MRRIAYIIVGCIIALVCAYAAVVSHSDSRSRYGRILRWFKGESRIDQYANDLKDDIRTKPELKRLQPWALELLERLQKGQVKTNGTADLRRIDKAVVLARSEIPAFIDDVWAFTNKSSGWVLPEAAVVFAGEKPACVVIDFSSYGVAIGPTNYQATFDADKVQQVLPGLYIYEFFE